MARIAVVGEPFEKALLQDLEKRQSLREHTIFPPGQERYIRPVDMDELQKALDAAGATEDAQDVYDGTVGADDISLGNIDTVVTSTALTAEEQQEIQDLISYEILETGHFLLSFDNGVIRGMLEAKDEDGEDNPWIKVFTDDGGALFEL